jgi:hypothetical protein
MKDSPENSINFDATHNTDIRVREQDTVNQYYYPCQIQFQTCNRSRHPGMGVNCGLLWGVEPHSIPNGEQQGWSTWTFPPARRVVVVPGLWQLRSRYDSGLRPRG